MIKKKYLKSGDIIVFKDNSRYWLNSKQAIQNFKDDDDKVIEVIRQISVNSPHFIGFISDKGQVKIAFWLTVNAKYATTKFKKSGKREGLYNVTIWKHK